MSSLSALSVFDIGWLRSASKVAGVTGVPKEIATRLLAGAYVQSDAKHCLTITAKGQIALRRLG
jgi:hypothetical protein